MRVRDADLTTVDPEDTAAARAWAGRRAAAQFRLSTAQAELTQLDAALARPPATTVLAQLSAAQGNTTTAQGAATDTAGRWTTDVTAAALFESNQLATAQADADAATKNVSDALVALLREASTTSALTATVDGLTLRQRHLAGSASPARWDYTTLPFPAHVGDQSLDPEVVLPAVGSPDFDAVMAVLARLDAGVDAVADLVTAESVHQLVQGNMVRSGAALDIAATGAVPDTFDVIRTAQSGEIVTHRVLLVADATDAADKPMWAPADGPASYADPLVAVWLTTMLPPPSGVGFVANQRDDVSGELAHPYAMTLDHLGLDPLELIRVVGDQGELLQRIAFVARRHWVTEPGVAWNEGTVELTALAASYSLADFIAAAELARGVLGRARALTPDDLARPTETPLGIPGESANALTGRVAVVETAMAVDVAALTAASTSSDQLDVAESLLAAARWAVPGATPQVAQDLPGLAVLKAQALRVGAELTRRQQSDPFQPVPADPDLTVRRARDRLVELLGRPLPVAVPITAPDTSAWETVVRDEQLSGAEPTVLRRWLDMYARVRPSLAALADAYELAETMGGGTLDLVATQLFNGGPGSIWHGTDPQPPASLVNIVVQRTFAGSPPLITGLVVDGWTQRVPATLHQAAVTFHIDQPDSAPPQVALVAVAPDLTAGRQPGSWDLELLADVILSTLALAQQRAVAAERTVVHGLTIKQFLR